MVYNKQKLHKVGYFKELMETNQDIGGVAAVVDDLPRDHRADRQDRECIDTLAAARSATQARVERLMTIPAVGPITALTGCSKSTM